MKLLRRRGKFYHVVIAIPVDLQPRIGRKQLWRSLQTERYKDARIHARKILQQADELFFILR